jgi:tyrosyl-tRNA synthetase
MEKGDGMSFAEFSYPLVQAWDWWHLFRKGVQIQIGGSDQFGNILAGAEAVKHIAKDSHEYQHELALAESVDKHQGVRVTSDPLGFTVPLLTTSSGEKFGKSAGNAVWLDPEQTSVFDLYQVCHLVSLLLPGTPLTTVKFFLRSADADAEKYLKLFTFLPLSDIRSIVEEHERDQSKRVAQHRLAKEFVELVHGVDAAETAEAEHRQLFNKKLTIGDVAARMGIKAPAGSPDTTTSSFMHPSLNKHAQPLRREDDTTLHVKLPKSVVLGKPLNHVLWATGLVSSRTEGHKLINAGGVYIGSNADAKGGMDDALSFTPARSTKWDDLRRYIIDENLLILRVGKWRLRIVNIVSDDEYEQSGLTCEPWELMKTEAAEAAETPANEGTKE